MVKAHLNQPHAKVIDSRAPERYRGEFEPIDPVAGHIPGALNQFWKHNLHETGQWRSPAELRQLWAPTHTADPVIVYCGSGVTACMNVLSRAIADLPLPKLYVGSWSDWCAGIATGDVTAAQAESSR